MKRLIYFLIAMLGFSLLGCEKKSNDVIIPDVNNPSQDDNKQEDENKDDNGENNGNDDNGNNNDNGYEEPVEYGCPHVKFTIKTRVVDVEGNAIPWIRIEGDFDSWEPYYTDNNGNVTDPIMFPYVEELGNETIYIDFVDEDGEENGGDFETKRVEIPAEAIVKIDDGNGSWNHGNYMAEIDDVVMELKNQDNTEE